MTVKLVDNDLVIGQLQLGKRPAVIAVDFSNGFTHKESPLGGDFASQLEANLKLVSAASVKNLPLFFSTVVYDNEQQASVFRQRLPALNILQRGSHWVDIHQQFTPYINDENVIEKHHPSAFFTTSLASKLSALKVDSLIITGLTTSGCVRATCVDGLQHNFLCAVVPEACGDRNQSAHDMSLHDMHAKYAQVLPLTQVLTYFESL
ncbi:MAG: nicotinamidase-related amidase [Alphaproteobacteria bacterium]|jgi:nicotinamidase-related amidase